MVVCFGSVSYQKSKGCKYDNCKAREMEGRKHISESARRMQKARVGALFIKHKDSKSRGPALRFVPSTGDFHEQQLTESMQETTQKLQYCCKKPGQLIAKFSNCNCPRQLGRKMAPESMITLSTRGFLQNSCTLSGLFPYQA